MMKKLFLALCAVLTLMSCEKVDLTDSGEETMPKGNLTVRVFRIDYTPFSTVTRTPIASACSRLNFALYNTEGSRVKQINQISDEAGFGTCSFQLEAGTYQLVVVGHSSDGNPTMTDATKIQFSQF